MVQTERLGLSTSCAQDKRSTNWTKSRNGAPWRIRILNLNVRSVALYLVELTGYVMAPYEEFESSLLRLEISCFIQLS